MGGGVTGLGVGRNTYNITADVNGDRLTDRPVNGSDSQLPWELRLLAWKLPRAGENDEGGDADHADHADQRGCLFSFEDTTRSKWAAGPKWRRSPTSRPVAFR